MVKNFLLVVLAIMVLQGCNNPNQSTTEQEIFPTLESAVNEFEKSVGENLVLVNTTNGEHLLLAEDNNNFFYVAGIFQEDKEFILRKLTARIDISGGGGGVEIILPDSKNKYFITVKENSIITHNEHTYSPFSQNKTFQVLAKKNGKTMIESYEKIK
ncbi:hypothetical protein [Lentibacillus sediminis]|uniref:hypothetical protein n=1 Tax=Lentibacillus sediminis TaxID=1940529 RepID=UPI000C1B93BC|nr:hypothetical protein [Lentibacillus sediminis]